MRGDARAAVQEREREWKAEQAGGKKMGRQEQLTREPCEWPAALHPPELQGLQGAQQELSRRYHGGQTWATREIRQRRW